MSVIGDGLDLLKLVNKGANADLYGKLGKFIEKATDLQAKVGELEDANRALTEKLRIKESLYQVYGVLFIQGDPFPLCSKCYEVDRKLVHLSLPKDLYTHGSNPRCPNCGTYYEKANYRDKLPGPEIKFLL